MYKLAVAIPFTRNCAQPVDDLFLLCYEWGFIMALSYHEQAYILDALNITPRYLDDTLNIDNLYVDNMVSQIKVSMGAKIRNRYNQVPHLTLQTVNFITSIPSNS